MATRKDEHFKKNINNLNNNIMTDQVYQILCRNIETCAISIQAALQALDSNREEDIEAALLYSFVPYKNYIKDITKEKALNMLLEGEKNIKRNK